MTSTSANPEPEDARLFVARKIPRLPVSMQREMTRAAVAPRVLRLTSMIATEPVTDELRAEIRGFNALDREPELECADEADFQRKDDELALFGPHQSPRRAELCRIVAISSSASSSSGEEAPPTEVELRALLKIHNRRRRIQRQCTDDLAGKCERFAKYGSQIWECGGSDDAQNEIQPPQNHHRSHRERQKAAKRAAKSLQIPAKDISGAAMKIMRLARMTNPTKRDATLNSWTAAERELWESAAAAVAPVLPTKVSETPGNCSTSLIRSAISTAFSEGYRAPQASAPLVRALIDRETLRTKAEKSFDFSKVKKEDLNADESPRCDGDSVGPLEMLLTNSNARRSLIQSTSSANFEATPQLSRTTRRKRRKRKERNGSSLVDAQIQKDLLLDRFSRGNASTSKKEEDPPSVGKKPADCPETPPSPSVHREKLERKLERARRKIWRYHFRLRAALSDGQAASQKRLLQLAEYEYRTRDIYGQISGQLAAMRSAAALACAPRPPPPPTIQQQNPPIRLLKCGESSSRASSDTTTTTTDAEVARLLADAPPPQIKNEQIM